MAIDNSSPLSLEGRTALVTGGSRGIGRAVSLALAHHGAFVAVNFRSGLDEAQRTLELIKEAGGHGSLLPFDVNDPRAVDESVRDLMAVRGQIQILVNNAGVSRDMLLGRMKDADWLDVLGVNLSGAFYTGRAVAKTMVRNRYGKIVNVASTAGEAGNAGQVNYSAAKAGLIGFTKALARELAPRNILVNAVSPGIVTEGMSGDLEDKQIEAIVSHVPLRRMGSADDVASAVVFLCSSMADYITGQVIRVNGGLYM
ncbi:MAG: 3-oxoacyl-ACP reductase FabG [Pseudomonadota bacterium]